MLPIDHDDPARILVVDDEQVIREILADFLSMEGYSVRTAENGILALEELDRSHYDLVLSDLKMPQMGGLEFLGEVRERAPSIITIIMTGFGTVESAIDAMKQGAYDYILKPFKVEDVVLTVRRGLEKRKLQAENLRLKEAISLYKVSEAIAASLSLQQILRTVVDSTIHEVGADEVIILLRDNLGNFVERCRELSPAIEHPPLGIELNLGALQSYFQEDRPLRAHGTKTMPYLNTVHNTRIQSLTVTTFRIRGDIVGYLCALSYTRGKRFDEGQRKLLSIVANRAAAAIENANLYENLKATFHQTIQGLASAIDTMDRYTAGHSDRVAAYSRELAVAMRLSDADIELIRQSAFMHDIGKIGCMINLNKAEKLTYDEYEEFKKHPVYGKEILGPITFLNPLIPGVYLHHERWDGRGYPLGIRGEEIPLMARVISVADTYDAMTSDRAYRKALPHKVAVDEILRCAGTQFDPEPARLFEDAIQRFRAERIAQGKAVPE